MNMNTDFNNTKQFWCTSLEAIPLSVLQNFVGLNRTLLHLVNLIVFLLITHNVFAQSSTTIEDFHSWKEVSNEVLTFKMPSARFEEFHLTEATGEFAFFFPQNTMDSFMACTSRGAYTSFGVYVGRGKVDFNKADSILRRELSSMATDFPEPLFQQVYSRIEQVKGVTAFEAKYISTDFAKTSENLEIIVLSGARFCLDFVIIYSVVGSNRAEVDELNNFMRSLKFR